MDEEATDGTDAEEIGKGENEARAQVADKLNQWEILIFCVTKPHSNIYDDMEYVNVKLV